MTNQNITQMLEPYGDISVVRQVASRLKLMLPGGARYTDEECLTLAQAAVLMDLNPINGELWLIKGEARDGKEGKTYGLMVGVKGLRKWARKQVREDGGNFWITLDIMSATDRANFVANMEQGAVVVVCKLFDTQTILSFTNSIKQMREAGMSYEDAKQIMGDQPYTMGYGIAWPSERSLMGLMARANKRAEADALKRRFGVQPGVQVAGVDDQSEYTPDGHDIINGDVVNTWARDARVDEDEAKRQAKADSAISVPERPLQEQRNQPSATTPALTSNGHSNSHTGDSPASPIAPVVARGQAIADLKTTIAQAKTRHLAMVDAGESMGAADLQGVLTQYEQALNRKGHTPTTDEINAARIAIEDAVGVTENES